MKKNKVAVVIPVYQTHLSALEKISMSQCFNVLSKHPIIAVKPQSLSLNNYACDFNEVISFEDKFFSNIAGYNKLMLSASFYEKFLDYEFILIYQLDAFAFKDDLLKWCNKDYDYVGAPWLRHAAYPDVFKKVKNRTLNFLHLNLNLKQPRTGLPTNFQFENKVGNGGFSLRRTKKFFQICNQEQKAIGYYNSKDEHYYHEDVFWSIEVNRKRKRLKIPYYKEAVHFAIENSYKHAFQLTAGELPFGCHAWNKHLEFWRPIFARIGAII